MDMARAKKSDRSKSEIMECLRQFHSVGRQGSKYAGIFDLRAFDHHRDIIRLCAFDGASEAQLTGRKLAGDPACLPSMRCVARDRAHAVRTNLKAPLRADPEMVRIWEQLMNKKDSLAKLLQYSPRCRNAHMECQKVVLNVDHVQGGGLGVVLKNFSFANQRFESEALPKRRIACTLMASMLFLTSEVDDPNRKKCEKENTDAILSVFNAQDMVLFGLEADLAGLGTQFLRCFDRHMPDPSLLPRYLRQFRADVSALFFEGKILHHSNKSTVVGIILGTLAGRKATFFGRIKSGRWVVGWATMKPCARP